MFGLVKSIGKGVESIEKGFDAATEKLGVGKEAKQVKDAAKKAAELTAELTADQVLQNVDFAATVIDEGSKVAEQGINEMSNAANNGVNTAVDGVNYAMGQLENLNEIGKKQALQNIASAAKFFMQSADKLGVAWTGEVRPKGSTPAELTLCKIHELLLIPEHIRKQCDDMNKSVEMLERFVKKCEAGGSVSQALAQFAKQLVDVLKTFSTKTLEQAKKLENESNKKYYVDHYKKKAKKRRQQIETDESVARKKPFPEIAEQANTIDAINNVLETKRNLLAITSPMAKPGMLIKVLLEPVMKFIEDVLQKTGIQGMLDKAEDLSQYFINEILNFTGLQKIKDEIEKEAKKVMEPLNDVITNRAKVHGKLTESLKLL